ncbi:MAG: hypothetical protein KAI38_07375, partial [Candidatus Latescibacteria bacterium]|nr:hypothetical protein [Candidatus Latescibacterota bacterium]
NTGESDLSVSNITSSDAQFSVSPASFTVAAGGDQNVTVMFAPASAGNQIATLTITNNDPDEGTATALFSGTGTDSPPTITSTPVTTQAEGRDLIMSASVTDAGGVQSVTLYYRAGGARTFTLLPMSEAGGDTYEATIPGSAVTYCGLEYYLSASDYTDNVVVLPEEGADNPYYVRVTFQDCIAEAAYPVGLWKMIGVPVMPDNGSPLEILTTLGAYDISKWRLFRFYWGAYHEFTHEDVGDFVPGRAFWLHTRIPDFRFRAGGGRTTPTDASFAITLDQGWTDIACPFAFPVRWDDVMAESGDPAGVSGPYTYDGAAWSFPNPADRLEPWEGYAVKNASTVAVTLNIPPRSAEASARPLAKPLADGEWMLRVKVYTDDFGFSIPQPVLSEAEGVRLHRDSGRDDNVR